MLHSSISQTPFDQWVEEDQHPHFPSPICIYHPHYTSLHFTHFYLSSSLHFTHFYLSSSLHLTWLHPFLFIILTTSPISIYHPHFISPIIQMHFIVILTLFFTFSFYLRLSSIGSEIIWNGWHHSNAERQRWFVCSSSRSTTRSTIRETCSSTFAWWRGLIQVSK